MLGEGERAAGKGLLGGKQACSRELEIQAEIREIGRPDVAPTEKFLFCSRCGRL